MIPAGIDKINVTFVIFYHVAEILALPYGAFISRQNHE